MLLAAVRRMGRARERLSARTASARGFVPLPMSQRPELHVVDDPAVVVGELLAAQARARRLDRAHRRRRRRRRPTSTPPARARLEQGHALVGRRTLRAARRRALELPAREGVAPRPPRRAPEAGAPHPRRARRPRTPPTSSTPRSPASTLDLLLLGIGRRRPHGVALPGLAAARRRWTAGRPGGPAGLEPFVDRVTMTMPVIRAARRIVLLVTGEAKAEAVARAFGGRDQPRSCPASLLRLAAVTGRGLPRPGRRVQDRADEHSRTRTAIADTTSSVDRPEQLKALGHPAAAEGAPGARRLGAAADEPRARGAAWPSTPATCTSTCACSTAPG